MTTKGDLACSFCGKRQHEVRKLILGPMVQICNECVDLCGDILNENHIPHWPGVRRHNRHSAAPVHGPAPSGGRATGTPQGPARVEMPDGTVTSLETSETDSVATLVRNLRARCDRETHLLWDRCTGQSHVVLPVDLVRAIADGIEAVAKLPSELASLDPQRTARDIERVVVKRLYRSAAKEHASARLAAEKLGASPDAMREAEEYRDERAPPQGLGAIATWLPAMLAGGLTLPILGLASQWAAKKGRAGG